MTKLELPVPIINTIISFYEGLECIYSYNHRLPYPDKYKIKRFYYSLTYPNNMYPAVVCCRCVRREFFVGSDGLLNDKSFYCFNKDYINIIYKRMRYIKPKQLYNILLKL